MDPEWVLDRAEFYEIDTLVEYYYYKDKGDWERSRLQIYSTYQSQSTKKIDFGNFMQFDWEKHEQELPEEEEYISHEDMLAELKAAEDKLNKKD